MASISKSAREPSALRALWTRIRTIDRLVGLGRQDRYIYYQRLMGRFVFIHINKCGGTSVERALGIPVKIHDTALRRRARLGAARWQAAFTFSIVRHPFERVASDYYFRVRTGQNGLGDGHLGLNAWVTRTYGERDPRYYDNPLLFAPCLDWLTDARGEIIVDYVARLETIERDWPEIQRRIGTTRPLPKVNSDAAARAAGETLDAESKALIKRYFAKDFEAFGYRPEG